MANREITVSTHTMQYLYTPFKCFSFLSSSSFSVDYPTEKQAKKWSNSLYDLLQDVTGRYRFEQFCKKQFCLENIRFWQACRDLKSLPLISVSGSAQLIYE